MSILSNVAFAQQTAAPTFSPVAVTTLPVDITIFSATAGASIYYTLDGSLPDNSSDHYTSPIFFDELSQRITLRSCAYADGMTKSNVSSLSYIKPLDLIPATVTRTVDNNTTCSPDVKISVVLTELVSVYAVEERLPANVTPFNISDAGQWDEETRIIRWGPFDDGQSRTLSYALAGPDMTLNFQGTASFDGQSLTPTGATQAAISCPIQQLQQVAAPVLTPNTGSVPLNVTATCATDGAVLRYITDGSVPDADDPTWENNTGKLVSAQTTFRVRAFKDGMAPSSTTLASYQRPVSFTAKQRTITGGGTCTLQVSLEVKPAAGVSTYAVEEVLGSGLQPKNINEGGHWDEYNRAIKWGPFDDAVQRTLTYELAGLQGNYTVSGRASADGRSEAISGTASLTITCSIQQVATPTIAPVSGSAVPLIVTLWCPTTGAVIKYTTDGTAPNEFSLTYTGSFELVAGTRVRARAYKDGLLPSGFFILLRNAHA
ncbi:MAG: chitobiase/beta-hexosaminidase C-terminal domain-containing protein [Pseudomonadota bacterium]